MQLAADRPGELGHAALDRHVDVLVAVANLELAPLELGRDAVQGRQQRVALVLVEDPGPMQAADVRARALDVLRPQPQVEADRGVETREERVLRLGEAGHGAVTIGSAARGPGGAGAEL